MCPPSHWVFGALGVWWVGGLVGGRRGCRAEGAGIQSNMRMEITIGPLGELQMLLLEGKLVGSYLHANMRNDKKQCIHPADVLLHFISCSFSRLLQLPRNFLYLFGKFDPLVVIRH